MAKTKVKKWYEQLPTVKERDRIDQLMRIKHAAELHQSAKMHIVDEGNLASAASWLIDGRGLRRWESVDLSTPRGDIMTPGDATKPHWAYTDAGELQTDQVRVEHRKSVAVPIEWYPGCHKCKGSRVRTVAEMAQIWQKSEAEALVNMQKPDWNWGPVTNGTFPCNYCRGTGHIHEPFIIQVVNKGWNGIKVSDVGKRNAVDMCCRLQAHYKYEVPDVNWDWDWYGPRQAAVKFFLLHVELLSDYLRRTVKAETGEQNG